MVVPFPLFFYGRMVTAFLKALFTAHNYLERTTVRDRSSSMDHFGHKTKFIYVFKVDYKASLSSLICIILTFCKTDDSYLQVIDDR